MVRNGPAAATPLVSMSLIVEVRLAGFAPVLLSVFARGSSLDDLVASAVDTRHRLAEAGETETFKTPFT
jgi:hypothetical protein